MYESRRSRDATPLVGLRKTKVSLMRFFELRVLQKQKILHLNVGGARGEL